MSYRLVCKSDEIQEKSMKMFRVDQTEVLVGRLYGKLFACNNSCPHRGASLVKGELKGIMLFAGCMDMNIMFLPASWKI